MRRDAHAAARPHRQHRAAHAADRPAVGDRAARPGAARPPRARAGRAQPRPRRRRHDRPRSCRAVAGADPAEVVSLTDALDDPGDLRLLEPRRGERFAPARGRAAHAARPRGEPLLDLVRRIIDTMRHRRRAGVVGQPAAAARRDNLDLFVKAVAEFQAVDGDGHAAGAAGLPRRPRTTRATASTSRPRPRPTRSSC